MHVVSRCDSRIELRSFLLQVGGAWARKSKPGRSLRSYRRGWIFAGQVALLLFVAVTAAWTQQAAEGDGIDSGNYNIKQSVEFGYRFTDFTGSQATYDTFVNLQQGPRLLDMTLEMRSLNHQGLLFDRLYLSNFGYGGDPNNVSRLRIGKNKWYDFDAHLPPRPECLGLLAAGQPAEPGQHVYQCSGRLQSHHQHPRRTCSTPGAAWATTT